MDFEYSSLEMSGRDKEREVKEIPSVLQRQMEEKQDICSCSRLQ